jgi:hypothetical protein
MLMSWQRRRSILMDLGADPGSMMVEIFFSTNKATSVKPVATWTFSQYTAVTRDHRQDSDVL